MAKKAVSDTPGGFVGGAFKKLYAEDVLAVYQLAK